MFLSQIRYSECIEELQATHESVCREISYLRSNDSKSENDASLKQQLNSLLYLRKNIDARIQRSENNKGHEWKKDPFKLIKSIILFVKTFEWFTCYLSFYVRHIKYSTKLLIASISFLISSITRLQSGSETDSLGLLPCHVDWNQMIGPGLSLFPLPIEVILKNNIALSYFMDYMSSIGCLAYIYFYLNIEGWKVSAEQKLQV